MVALKVQGIRNHAIKRIMVCLVIVMVSFVLGRFM